MARRHAEFQTIRSEGGLLPPDLLRRVLDAQDKLDGTRAEDYGLPPGERLNEVVTQSWNRLRKHWTEFRKAASNLPNDEPGTGLTNEKWNLPLLRELGFGFLQTSPAPEIDGRTYAIARFFGPVPVHLIGCGLSLDRRAAGVRGAAAVNPHGLVQEFLNRSPDHLWAIVSNGLRLRVLRDNQALSRQSFLEFDLEAMFSGEVYSDFVLCWLIAHATRFAPREVERPDTCWLEQWTKIAEEQGSRALGDLRIGVEKAIQILGEGFTSHPKNARLREALRTGDPPLVDFHGQLLRVIYRLIFLFVAEDRTIDGQSLLHPPDTSEAGRIARDRYAAHYSTARLREMAGRIKGGRHGDLWKHLGILVKALHGTEDAAKTREHLALPTLGSFLWNPNSTAAINDAELSNFDFLETVRHLAFVHKHKMLRPVDYKNLGAEELGGVYESLLGLTPQLSSDGARFNFAEFAGNERKTSGSYYTPDSLVQCLLDSALDPVVEDAIKGKAGRDAEKAILALKVCDPAVGSGHFLVGAAHRLARHLARVRSLAEGDGEPAPTLYQHALRDVIGHCLYGVDVNPMAAELCRVGLWLEALEPGKPLSFLDHHIRVGHSLLGATPDLLAGGIPDEAFKAIEGDDKKACIALKKRNKAERKGWGPLFVQQDAEAQASLERAAAALDNLPDARPEDIRAKELVFRRDESTDTYRRKKRLADAWCAAFVIEKRFSEQGRDSTATGITQGHLNDIAQGRPIPVDLAGEIDHLTDEYRFFHWHLAFPEVYAKGGFDCILGNPPWDTLSPDQREFFGRYRSGMRSLSPDQQKTVVEELVADDTIAGAWREHCRYLYSVVHFLKRSGRFTLYAPGNLGKGDFNIYRMFVELALKGVRLLGAAAQIAPAGLYGGANASAIRKFILDENCLMLLLGCENRGESFFSGVHPQTWFALYVVRRGERTARFRAAFGCEHPDQVTPLLQAAMEIDADTIRALSPSTYAIPDMRVASDITVSAQMYDRYPTFGDASAGPPIRHYQREIDMGNDRDLFTTDPEGLPVYEGRMIDHFDHRAKTYVSGHGNSAVWEPHKFGDRLKAIVPQWRVLRQDAPTKLGDRVDLFRIGFGDVANPRNERSLVAALIPPATVCGHTVPTIVFDRSLEWAYLPWLAVANSFVMDALVRRKLSSPHMTFSVFDSLPFPRPPIDDDWVQRIAPLVLRLVCTGTEMTAFWNAMAKHDFCESVPEATVPPTALSDEELRALARAEVDAVIARDVYGLSRQELSDVMDTFPVLQKRDVKAYGEYKTKSQILEFFDDPTLTVQISSAEEVGERRPQVPVAAFTEHAYPATEADRAICSAALDIVEQSDGISSMEHLDALLLATHPDWCRLFLDEKGRTMLNEAIRSTPQALFAMQSQTLRWKDCRDHLERVGAVAVAHGGEGQPITAGVALTSAKAALPNGIDMVVTSALTALRRIRELRKDLSTLPQSQRAVLDAFAEQHRLCGLAA